MFIDVIEIEIKAGEGGNGAIAYRREKFVDRGGAYGGNGGRGGDIVFETTSHLTTLMDFKYRSKWHGFNGVNGLTKKMHGANGEPLIIKVPIGTIIYDATTNQVLADMNRLNQRETILRGGRGGRGNAEFVTSTYQTPDIAENGEPTKPLLVRLELKLLADVGLVGLPNVGKSSFLGQVTAAKPKIANYEFTTLIPNLGVVESKSGSYVIADLPGLIKGASHGAGLGEQFLRHVQRTKLILHFIDVSHEDPYEDYLTIRKELEYYGHGVENKPELIVINKVDIDGSELVIEELREKFADKNIFCISALAGGFDHQQLLDKVAELNQKYKQEQVIDFEAQDQHVTYTFNASNEILYDKLDDDLYEVTGDRVEKLVKMSNITTFEGLRRFSKKIEEMGIMDQLRAMGVQEGDIIRLFDIELEYHE